MKIPATEAEHTQVALILSGLLASGHFTFQRKDDEGELEAECIRCDCGKDWKEDGFHRRWRRDAVSEAVSIWQEMEEDIAAIIPNE